MFEHLDNHEFEGFTPGLRTRVQRTAHRSRQRRRNLTVAAVTVPVLAVAGGVILQRTRSDQLGRIEVRNEAGTPTTSSSVPVKPPTSSPVAGDTSDTSSATPQSGAATNTGSTPGSTAGSTAGTNSASSPAFPNATPANVVPSNFTWSVVDASSPEARTAQFDTSQRYVLDPTPYMDGVMVNSPEMNLYEQVDRTWKPVRFNNAGILAVVSGDTIYGISSGDPDSGGPASPSFGTFDVASGTWQLHDVPEQLRPYESDNIESQWAVFGATAIDGGMIVSVNTSAKPRADRFKQLPLAETVFAGPYVEGNLLVYYMDCNFSDASAADWADPDLKGIAFAQRFCDKRTFDATSLGLSQADLAALTVTSSLWVVTADSMVPVEFSSLSPTDARNLVPGDGLLEPDTFPSWPVYTVDNDGSIANVFGDVAAEVVQATGGTDVTRGPGNGSAVAVVGNYLLTASPGAPTQVTDLLPAITPPNTVDASFDLDAVGNTGDTSFATGAINYDDPSDDAAPTTLTNARYSLVITKGGYHVLDSTGATLNLDPHANISDALAGELAQPIFWTWATDSGKVGLFSAGTPTSSFEVPVATFDLDWTSLPGTASATRSIIVTSHDGTNVAIEDLDEIVREAVGLANDQHVVLHSYGPATANGKIFVPFVTATARDMATADIATPNQHVRLLVGTPKP